MKLRLFYCLFVLLLSSSGASAIELQATYIDKEGMQTTTSQSFTADAPLHVHFTYDVSSLTDGATTEWHIRHQSSGTNITRYDTELDFEFTEAGLNVISLWVRQGNEVVDSASIGITITESHLEMPNAFSPNGDGINDIYQAKSNYKSIIEFHAYIFNRHGQKLYEWTDYTSPDSGWDGTYHGSPVKDGVYYVYVKARGADGIDYNIRRDVNLIRHFNVVTTNSNE